MEFMCTSNANSFVLVQLHNKFIEGIYKNICQILYSWDLSTSIGNKDTIVEIVCFGKLIDLKYIDSLVILFALLRLCSANQT